MDPWDNMVLVFLNKWAEQAVTVSHWHEDRKTEFFNKQGGTDVTYALVLAGDLHPKTRIEGGHGIWFR